jgi:ligand-binding sensor domain-containing protein
MNDSLLLLGGHAFAFVYNLKTKKAIDSIAKRVVSLGNDLSGNIYIGSNEGLFLWKEKNCTRSQIKEKDSRIKLVHWPVRPITSCGLDWVQIH